MYGVLLIMTMYAYIGSYAAPSEPGLRVCAYDPDTGRLELIQEVEGLSNPTFLDIDATKRRLYAILDETDEQGKRTAAAAAYEIDPANGMLKLLHKVPTVQAPTCHITLDETRSCIIVSSYHGGLVGVSLLREDGTIAPASDVLQHHGSSLLPVQSQARTHSVFIAPGNRFAVACDLGLDKVFVYRLDAAEGKLSLQSEVSVTPGSGPRHFAFHPTQPYGYLINELSATITAFHYDAEQGKLTELQTVSTLPDGFEGDNACADIHLSRDGHYLYGSNRGHDSIAVYAVDQQTGRLSLVQHVSTGGGHPRNFALSPDNRFLLAANRDGNNVVTFRRDEQSGKLEPTGDELTASKPVCVKFADIHA